MSCASEGPASGTWSELCRSSPSHIEGSVLTKQWRAPHDSARPSPCHNSQRCPGPPHPAPGDLDGGPTAGFRGFFNSPPGPGVPDGQACSDVRVPGIPSRCLTPSLTTVPEGAPSGWMEQRLSWEQTWGASPLPWAGWAGRTWLTLGGRDCGSIFKEHVRIFTTLPGFIRATPELTLFLENRLRSAKRFISLTKPEVSEQANRRPSECCSRLSPAAPVQTDSTPQGQRTQPAVITCFQPLKTLPLPPLLPHLLPPGSLRGCGWGGRGTWVSPPCRPGPQGTPPSPSCRPPPGVCACHPPLRSPPGLSLLQGL